MSLQFKKEAIPLKKNSQKIKENYFKYMRTKEELNSPEFNDDMSELEAELKVRGVKYTIKKHAGALEGGGKVKELIGYYPAGEWHIHVGDVSIIRGMASFGMYEAFGGKYVRDPERFTTAKELVDDLLK